MVRAAVAALLLTALPPAAALRKLATFEPRSWEQAQAKAKNVTQRISFADRKGLVHGQKVYEEHKKWNAPEPVIICHKGYTRRIKELGVPILKMEDGASGFRNPDDAVGASTCFPSMLALASTWDPKLARAMGAAIGKEFKGKGANVLLGPSLAVHHGAGDGRNAESLSGEDPYLGASLGREYVGGVQGQGVVAAVRHFAFAEPKAFGPAQVEVDDVTAWELYYPPFQAAVEAGAVAMMCGGNAVNGVTACGNEKLLKRDLKQAMGFKGIVVSDWGVTVPGGLSLGGMKMLQNGLDLEMPVEALLSKEALFFGNHDLQHQMFETVTERILTAIYKMRLEEDEGCAGPHRCHDDLYSNQSRKEHVSLSRGVATEAVTLLQNDGILPLDPTRVKTVAIVGSAAAALQEARGKTAGDLYSAGGVDYCRAASVVTPLKGISQRARELGIKVVAATSEKQEDAVAAARSADVVIVVDGATSSSSGVRSSLSIGDGLIDAVAAVKPTVVLMQTPGAVLTPWRTRVSAIANLFLAGPETGNAWAAMLFGDADPAGRLPVMFPADANDTVMRKEPSPEETSTVAYSEGLFTSYRSETFKAAFPFGHGLSFTTFTYGEPAVARRCQTGKYCVRMKVSNSGSRPGREVAQAYLEFPAEAKMPRKLLRGFKKTSLIQPGEEEELSFAFTERDLSTYQKGNWTQWEGVVAHLGASSGDLRHRLVLQPPPPEEETTAKPAVLAAEVTPTEAPAKEASKKSSQKSGRNKAKQSHVKKHA